MYVSVPVAIAIGVVALAAVSFMVAAAFVGGHTLGSRRLQRPSGTEEAR